MSVVTLLNGKTFESQPGANILESALASGVTLEYSCKTGRCGVCMAKVNRGATELLQTEEALTADQVQAGYILTCCRQAQSDVQLEAEDLPQLAGIQVKTHPARVDSIQPLNQDVLELQLRLPPAAQFKYLPGQYISVIGPNGVRRSYSIANAPREDGKLSLQIKKVEHGVLSHYWFSQVKPNDLLRIEGPMGTFFLRESKPEKLILLATGTGIAPIRALLENLARMPIELLPQIHVYWGNRFEADIYSDLQNHLQSGATLNLVLSRPDSSWQGFRGYVQNIALEHHRNLENTEVYACGSNNMIQDAREKFEAAGLNRHKFYSDAFVSSST